MQHVREEGEMEWTEARVLAAYQEWNALNEHAGKVVREMIQASGGEDPFFCELRLPSWCGTHWPGREFEYLQEGDQERPSRAPFEWLWTYPKCVNEEREKREAWKRTDEARVKEQVERAEYERLKAKFEVQE